MIDGLDRDDAVIVDEYKTAAAVWTQLRVKYCKTDKSMARINMSAIQNFEYTEESKIDSSWTKLKEYRRKVIAANTCYAAVYPDDVLFHVLTSALYKAKRYTGVLDGFMTQNLSVEESLKILQEKESQVREAELVKVTSLAARRQKVFDRRNSGSDSDVEMVDLTTKYYCCGSKEHFVADCEYQAASNEYARKLRLKKENSRKTKQNTKLKKSRVTQALKRKIQLKDQEKVMRLLILRLLPMKSTPLNQTPKILMMKSWHFPRKT
ncbi:hypothetical protein K3495_g4707 [Podosphaera aphanis]|nr:hypothetical protein K3495_g4707 [Podosphaera aphanis]